MLDAFSGMSLGAKASESETAVRDITDQYFSACRNGLDVGELIRQPGFSLQDSIAALEIMDPKMDNGVIDDLDVGRDPYDCSKSLEPREVLEIMDQLFAMEMTWHSGSSLSQTLYTCVYLQKVIDKTEAVAKFSSDATGSDFSRRLLDDVLYPYMISTVKCSEILREEYLTGYLYEEEDVSSTDFGLELLPFESIDSAATHLCSGLAWLKEELKSASPEMVAELDQLASRLKYRVHLQELLRNLDHPEEWNSSIDIILQTIAQVKPSEAQLPALEAIFNTRIQRILISTSPPRPIMSMSVPEAYSELRRCCRDLLRLLPATTAARDSPACMLAFFNLIRKDDPPTLPLVRSRLQNLFLSDKLAQHSVNKQRFLIRAIEEVCGQRDDLFNNAKVEIPSDNRFTIHDLVTSTLARLELPFLDYFKILCHNPGRQRRNLCKILADFDVLQAESELVDQQLADLVGESPKRLSNGHTSLSFTLSSWVFNTKLDVSCAILLIGFETELYRPFEWSMIYWHLDNLLYLQYEHLGSIVIDRLPNYSPARAHLAHRLLYIEAMGLLSKAFVRLLTALDLLGVITTPTLKFSSAELLYRHRMAPFAGLVSPPPVSFDIYRAESAFEGATHRDLLLEAGEYFGQARGKFSTLSKRGPSLLLGTVPALVEDFRRDVRGLLGCCIANNLTVNDLSKRDPAWFETKVMKWNTSKFSKHFPVISIEAA